MTIFTLVIGTVDVYDESTSLMRMLLLFIFVFLIAAGWVFLRRRWAPRTIENWRGTGIHTGLSPLQAALLLRAHPSVLVAIALESRLASGEARITAIKPLTVDWPDRDPDGPVEEALSRAVDEKGRFDPDGVDAFLDALYADVNDAMTHHSGRQTAVALRKRVAALWVAALRADSIDPTDRAWLMIQEAEKVIDRIGPGETGEILHDVIRLGGVFRAHLLPAQRISEKAYVAKSGYYRYRKDLAVSRPALGRRFQYEDESFPPSPFDLKLRALASSLDGDLSYGSSAVPLPFNFAVRMGGPSVAGRYHGRPASVLMGPNDLTEIEIASSAGLRMQILPTEETADVERRFEDRVQSGDPTFDRDFDVCHLDCRGLETWLKMPGFREAILSLMPFTELRGRDQVLCLSFACERHTFTVKSIRDRFAPLLALAEDLERRVSTTAPRDPE
jgi:hypothetical protein